MCLTNSLTHSPPRGGRPVNRWLMPSYRCRLRGCSDRVLYGLLLQRHYRVGDLLLLCFVYHSAAVDDVQQLHHPLTLGHESRSIQGQRLFRLSVRGEGRVRCRVRMKSRSAERWRATTLRSRVLGPVSRSKSVKDGRGQGQRGNDDVQQLVEHGQLLRRSAAGRQRHDDDGGRTGDDRVWGDGVRSWNGHASRKLHRQRHTLRRSVAGSRVFRVRLGLLLFLRVSSS